MTIARFTLAAAVLAPAAGAVAFPSYLQAWIERYPTSTLPARMAQITGESCNTCHHPPFRSTPGTCYREDLRARLNMGMNIQQAIAAIETIDSDGDGVNNVTEILAPRPDQPGQIGFHPGLRGPLGTDPCFTDPNEPVTNQNETPVVCYPNCDGSTGNPLLTPADFVCFLNRFRAGDSYANCDGSTGNPALTPADFVCFLNRFRAGC